MSETEIGVWAITIGAVALAFIFTAVFRGPYN